MGKIFAIIKTQLNLLGRLKMSDDFILTSIVIPKYQDDYCKEMGITKKEAYTSAFDKIYFEGGFGKLKKLELLKTQKKELEEEIKKDKNRKLSSQEIKYLKESKNSLQKGNKEQIDIRFNAFQRKYKRYYHNLEEFIKLIKEVNNIT